MLQIPLLNVFVLPLTAVTITWWIFLKSQQQQQQQNQQQHNGKKIIIPNFIAKKSSTRNNKNLHGYFGDGRQQFLEEGSNGNRKHCEGYWSDTDICLELGTTKPPLYSKNKLNANCPQWYINPSWKGRDEFSSKLHEMEYIAKEWNKKLLDFTTTTTDTDTDDNNNNDNDDDSLCYHQLHLQQKKPIITIHSERGIAWSRIEEGIIAGNSEYHSFIILINEEISAGRKHNNINSNDHITAVVNTSKQQQEEEQQQQQQDTNNNNNEGIFVCWTDALLPLYVDKFYVEPSEQFQFYVSNFNLNQFRKDYESFLSKIVTP